VWEQGLPHRRLVDHHSASGKPIRHCPAHRHPQRLRPWSWAGRHGVDPLITFSNSCSQLCSWHLNSSTFTGSPTVPVGLLVSGISPTSSLVCRRIAVPPHLGQVSIMLIFLPMEPFRCPTSVSRVTCTSNSGNGGHHEGQLPCQRPCQDHPRLVRASGVGRTSLQPHSRRQGRCFILPYCDGLEERSGCNHSAASLIAPCRLLVAQELLPGGCSSALATRAFQG
jgi:hypothetical protein